MTEDLDPTLDSGSQPTVPSSMDGAGLGSLADPSQLEGQTLGDFRLLHEIGRGGMGIVHKAEQLSLQRPVALKILPAQLTMNERALERFQREASITAQLVHRNIVDIYAVGEAHGVHFIAMELVQGSNLEQLIQRMRGEDFGELSGQAIRDIVSVHPLHGDLDENLGEKGGSGSKLREITPSPRKATSSAHSKNYVESVVKLVAQIADGLHHAHEAGVIHRDIKPANILLRADGTPVLTDFGLARAEGLPNVSATGEFAGTPNYVSPEQAMAHRIPVDHRTDIFSLGATLYELLTLELAFGGDSIHTVLQKIISKEVRDPHKLNPILAPDLVTIIYKTLEKDPDRRYQTAEELADDLRAFASYRPIRATRTPTVIRALRWMRREPLKAAGIVGAVVGLPLVLVLVLVLRTQQGEIQAFGQQAQAQKLEEDVERGLASAWSAFAERLPGVVELFGQVLELDPDSVEARAGMALSLSDLGYTDQALAVLDEEAQEPLHPALALHKIDLLRMRGETSRADQLEQELASLPPGEESHLELYLRALRLLGNHPLDSLYKRGTSNSEYRGRRQLTRGVTEEAAKALELLDQACREKNDSPLYYDAYAWALWAAGDEDPRAISYMQREWADRALTHLWIGIALTFSDPEGAIASLDRALELNPELRVARDQRNLIRLNMGGTLGDEELDSLVETQKNIAKQHPTYALGWANAAAALFYQGEFEESEEACRKALYLDPELVEVYDTLGTVLYSEGRLEEALEAFRKGVELDPESVPLHSDLGLTLHALGRLEEAAAELEIAHEIDPDDVIVLENLGAVQTDLGNLDAAEDSYRRAIRIDSEYAPVWNGLGNVLLTLGENYEAIHAFEEAVRLAPDTANYRFMLGNALAADGSLDEAAEQFGRAIELDPDDPLNYTYLAAVHDARGRADEKLEMYRKRLQRLPDSPEALNHVAWELVNPKNDPALHDEEEALELARRAFELTNGEDYLVLDTYAYALFENGRASEAARHQRRALELFEQDPGDPKTREELEKHLATFEAEL